MTTATQVREPERVQGGMTFLADVLQHVKDRPVLARVELPATPISFSALLETPFPAKIAELPASSIWREPSGGSFFATWGAAATLYPSGVDRVASLSRDAGALFRRVERFFYAGRGPGARLIGGLSFAGPSRNPSWDGFGSGRFVLPRWELRSDGCEAWLCLNLDLGEDQDLEAPLREYKWLTQAIETRAQPEAAGASSMETVEHLSESEWIALVDAAKGAISRDELRKVVLARRSVVETTRALSVRSVLASLNRAYPGCFLFSFAGDSKAQDDVSYFVGASPERLVSLQGHQFYADALAGSVDPATPNAEAWLRDSDKDRAEHAFVVDEIVDRVRLLCTELTVPETPALKRLKNIVHLHTPIEGTLKSRLHVLELLSLLHPTPAVCGVPVDSARQWIEENENMGRGWYAGPVGWFDEQGQGEFSVALRSGLIRGRRAELFAGAGIVRDSDPVSEYKETSAKLQAMLSALGLSG